MESELVSVLVPKTLVTRLYAWIAAQSDQVISEPASQSKAPLIGDWSTNAIRRMVAESPLAMRCILRALAEEAGQELTTEKLAKSIKHKPAANFMTVAGTVGAFSRRCKNRYGIDSLPFQSRWDHALNCKVHEMPKEIAEEVLRSLKSNARQC